MPQDDEEHKEKADRVTIGMLLTFDLNKDGVITLNELEEVGLDRMPNFDNIGAEGHHYDVESGTSVRLLASLPSINIRTEFFLHHEGSRISHAGSTDLMISLPTQKNTITRPRRRRMSHITIPKTLSTFPHHEGIEKDEMERLAKFQGISVEELAKYQGRPAEANDSVRSVSYCNRRSY